jgi:hypothetical protein
MDAHGEGVDAKEHLDGAYFDKLRRSEHVDRVKGLFVKSPVVEVENEKCIGEYRFRNIEGKDRIFSYWGGHSQSAEPVCRMLSNYFARNPFIFIEIGCQTGGLSNIILSEFPEATVHAIDIIDALSNPMLKDDRRFKFVHGSSLDVHSKYGDESVDVIYIDTDPHEYDMLKKEISVWHPKVKTGGLIMFHDYHHPSFPGVTKAIDEFIAENKYCLVGLPYNNAALVVNRNSGLKPRQPQNDRIIVASPNGGIGNRILLMASTAVIGNHLNREFMWHWMYNGHNGVPVPFYDLFETDDQEFDFHSCVNKTIKVYNSTIVNISDTTDDILVLLGHTFKNIIEHDNITLHEEACEWICNLKPKKHLLDKIEYLDKQYNISQCHGVHIRRTDCIDNMSDEYFSEKICALDGPVYLATDCMNTRNKFKKMFNNIITMDFEYTEHQFRSNPQSSYDSIVEMYLLTRTQSFIPSASTFSDLVQIIRHENYRKLI